MFKFFRARMSGWLLVTLLLVAAIAVTAPQLLLVSFYKLSLITSAAWVAYWIDRSLFPYARPDCYLSEFGQPVPEHRVVFAAAQVRRAIIIAAAMIGVALGA